MTSLGGRFSRFKKRSDSLFSIREHVESSSKGSVSRSTRSSSDSDRLTPIEIIHQTDKPKPFALHRIQRAETLIPVIKELRQLHEELMSELFFHRNSFAKEGIFIMDQSSGTYLSAGAKEFLFSDVILNSIREDDVEHNSTYYNRVTNERLLSIIHTVASMKNMPIVSRIEY